VGGYIELHLTPIRFYALILSFSSVLTILWDTRVVTGLGHKSSHSLGPWFEPRRGARGKIRLWYRRYQVEYPLVGDGAENTTGASDPAG